MKGHAREWGSLRPGAAGLAAGSAAALAAGYWLCMSPYSQILGEFPYRGPAGGRRIALTFDDGPNEPYTSAIADFLDERDIKATFFQVGRAVLRHPHVSARLVRAGHVVGCHGQTHEFTNYLRRDTLAEEVRLASEALATVGIRPALYRPPWLLRTAALRAIARHHGMRVISGEFCHPLEVLQPRPEVIARAAVAKARPGSILIFHDGHDGHEGNRASTVAAAKIVVELLSAEGYTFTTVDRLLGIPAYQDADASAVVS